MTRHNNFDALRLIGALLVLWSHMFALSGRAEPFFYGRQSFGNLGLLLFFSISGYLVTASWLRDPDLGRFLAKRFRRIVPALAVSIPLTAALAYGFDAWRPGNPHYPLNGSLWTIPFEVYCYLLVAGLALVTRSFALALALLMLLCAQTDPANRNNPLYFTIYGMFFAMGALLCVYPKLRKAWPALVVAGLWLLLGRFETMLGLAFIVAPLVIEAGVRSWPLLRDAGRYGDFSYGIYIYAWPVQLVMVKLMPDAAYSTLLASTLLVVVPLAIGSWHFIESPALGRKPSPRRAERLPEEGKIQVENSGG